MEGVMMKNGNKYAVAVRKPDGDIVVDTQVFKNTGGESWVNRTPVIRGVAAFIDSLRLGIGTLMYSAEFFEDDEDESAKKKKKSRKQKEQEDKLMMTATVLLSIVMAIGIFMLLPYFLSQLLKKVITSPFLLTLCEGLIRIVLFLGYIVAISCMKDIKRVFMYHGAEHKSINCIENGCILSVDNVKKQSRRHKRCGTSFLLIVMVISVFFFMFIRVDSAWLRIVLRLLLIPVIAGISYEFIRLAGRSDSKIVEILSKPGLALQGLTTAEPDDAMIEVAIASVEAVFDWKHFLATYDEPGEAKCDLDRSGSADDDTGEAQEAADDEKEAAAEETVKKETLEKETVKKETAKKETVKKEDSGVKTPHKKDKEAAKHENRSHTGEPHTDKPEKASVEKPDSTPAKEEQVEESASDAAENTSRGYMRTGRFMTTDLTKPILVEDDEDEDDDILKALDKMFTAKKDEGKTGK